MKKTVKMVTMTMVFTAMAMGITTAEAAVRGKATALEKMHMYFVHHNFGFARNFYRFHPGPHWDLMNASALHLTAAQIKQEKMLVTGMMQDTKQGVVTLKNAYRKYREYAKQPNPSIRVLIHDVQAVGHAQAYLGYEMIPYHIRALRITKISRLENGIFPLPRRFQAIFTHYPYFICVFSVFLAFFMGFGRIDPYLATDCCIKQVNRRML